MELSSIYSDGMVLQRNMPIRIAGKTKPNQTVHLTFVNKNYETIADEKGDFSITLDPLLAGGPYEMKIISDETKVLRDLFVGDVYLLGGQSNMELPLYRTADLFADVIKKIEEPQIRQFAVPQEYDFHAPRRSLKGGAWVQAIQPDVNDFSAVGYFFAQKIYEKYQIPIGLIMAAVGGTPIEAWMREETLRSFKRYDEVLERTKDDQYVKGTIKSEEKAQQEWYTYLNTHDKGLQEKWYDPTYDTASWESFDVPNTWEGTKMENLRGAVWFQKRFEVPSHVTDNEALLKLGTIVDADDTYINGVHVGSTAYQYPPRRYKIPKGILKPGENVITVRVISTHNQGEFIQGMPYQIITNKDEINLQGTWKYKIGVQTASLPQQTFFRNFPAGLYNGMIAPLGEFPIRGVLWYQGESNTWNPHGYSELFEKLTEDWRDTWKNKDLPFLFTQLSNLETKDPNHHWAVLRHEQLKCLKIPHTGMAVTIDVGEYNDLHPQNKKAVGERLALAAINKVYGEEIIFSGPIYRKKEIQDHKIILSFDHVGRGLTILSNHEEDDELKGFMIARKDGDFLQAKAEINGDKVVVYHEDIKDPVHVRYAWSDNPEDANLYNVEGLPASPFTTEPYEEL